MQINPVVRNNTSTGRIMRELGEIAISNGWDNYIAYSKGRDGVPPSSSKLVPIGNKVSVFLHGLMTRLFDRHGLHSSLSTISFIRKIKQIKPDVIHIHNIHGYFLNYKILFKYLSKAGIPVVWTVHDCWLYTGHCYHYAKADCYKWRTGCEHCPQKTAFPTSILIDRSKQNWIDKAKAFNSIPSGLLTIVPVSNWMREEMSESFLKNASFKVIHNGIDLSVFDVVPSFSFPLLKELAGKSIILGVASIWSKEKGLDDFLGLSKLIGDNEVIVLVGLKREQQANLPANVIGLSRTENVHQLAEMYSAAVALVNPTWQDNFPTVNMESIACGTPVLTYRTGGSVETITEDTGFVVEQGDVSGLYDSLRIIEDRGKDYYQGRCREYALKHFAKEERYKDYIQLYEDIRVR